MIKAAAGYSIVGRAQEKKLVEIQTWNPRDYAADKHRTVDDRPYGGGPGMVMKYQPLHEALTAARQACSLAAKVVYLSPQGRALTQELLAKTAVEDNRLILVAGRYEGVDERFIELDCTDEWSIGDYVISGGELAALVVIDAIVRLLPGVLGDEESARHDSYMNGLLDFPHYTRPDALQEKIVPAVLLNGNHAEIKRWRMQQSLGRTWIKRPDLLEKKTLTNEQQALLKEFLNQNKLNS